MSGLSGKVAYTTLGLLNCALFFTNAMQWQGKFMEPAEEPWFLFSQYDTSYPMVGSLLAFGLFTAPALFLFLLKGQNTKPGMVNVLHVCALIASMMTIALSGVMLGSGFGDAFSGWNQPEGSTERGVFGFVWGGMMGLATGTLLYSGNEIRKSFKPKQEPLLG